MYNCEIHACGTARSYRKHFPQDLVTHAIVGNRGLYNYHSNEELLAAVWVDKRANCFLSTIQPTGSPADAEPPTVKRSIDGSQVDISCLPLLPNYQTYMCRFDQEDQLQGRIQDLGWGVLNFATQSKFNHMHLYSALSFHL